MESRNFCDMSEAEREAALMTIETDKEQVRELLKSAYGDCYHTTDGGGSRLYRMTGFGYQWCNAEELGQAARNWLDGYREFWVRCGGAEMRCIMHAFPDFTVHEYLNADTYGRRPIGSTLRPEETNEFRPAARGGKVREVK